MVKSRVTNWNPVARWILFLVTLLGLALVTAVAPMEKDLGANARLVYFHGAWVWAGLVLFSAAAGSGFLALLSRRAPLHCWSKSLGWTGMLFWLTYLPMALAVMWINWGGFFLDEPRWKVALIFAVAGILLQCGLILLNRPVLTSLFNIGFAGSMIFSLSRITNVFHPDSPILNSNSRSIQLFFAGLLILSVFAGIQVASAIVMRLQGK